MANARQGFGHRMRELRVHKGLSQERLGVLASLDRSYVGGVERGQRNVSLENIAAIARALGVNIATLFSETDNEAATPEPKSRKGQPYGKDTKKKN